MLMRACVPDFSYAFACGETMRKQNTHPSAAHWITNRIPVKPIVVTVVASQDGHINQSARATKPASRAEELAHALRNCCKNVSTSVESGAIGPAANAAESYHRRRAQP